MTRATTAFDRLRELEQLAALHPAAATWWDDVPCCARRCLVEVLSPGPGGAQTWYASLIGSTRAAVEIEVPRGVSGRAPGAPGDLVYIDDTDGWGWAKVTRRFGGREVVSGLFHRVSVLAYSDDG